MLDPMITNKLLASLRCIPIKSSGQNALTKKEERILALLSEGLSNKEIAKETFLSDKTVRNYVSNILNKLNLNNRAEAAVFAVKNAVK